MPTAQHRNQRRMFIRLQGALWVAFGIALVVHGHTYPTMPRWLPDAIENIDLFGFMFIGIGLIALVLSHYSSRARAAETAAFLVLFVPPGIVGVVLVFSDWFGSSEGGIIFGFLMLMLAAITYLMAGLRPVVVHDEALNGGTKSGQS